MKLFSALILALGILVNGGLRAATPHSDVRIATPWPAQNTIIAMLGYGNNIVGTSIVAKQIPLFRQSLPGIEKAALVSVNGSRELNPEQLITLGVQILFVPEGMTVPMANRLEQTGLRILTFKADAMKALTDRVQKTADALGEDAREKAQDYQRYFDRNVALVASRLQGLPLERRITVYHSVDNPLTTSSRPSLNQDWMDLAGARNIAENWSGGVKKGSGEVSLEKIVAANPAVIVAMNKRDADEILASPVWAAVDAVAHRRVYVNPKGMFWWCRETSEEALQFLWLAKTLYPERFTDVDMRQETHDFYQRFFGLQLSEAQIGDILNPPR